MAINTRIRVQPDIETYLKSQSQRVLDIPPQQLTAAELTTLANRIIYEHKLAQSMMRQEFIPRLLGWLKGLVAGNNSKVVALPKAQQPALMEAEDQDFITDFAAQFDEDETNAA
ncbi:MAG: hypothetical protein F6K36_28425 [Symploca sp. SIO3C6]|nr:hypothetical protein [Symploca sp. SIO3C6]